ncbi:MAG TPA: hypothetical protein VFR41_03225 [Acidimicrobiia bacterium]|nr:hypothetical protein [Acidimicrobiia bacterium]
MSAYDDALVLLRPTGAEFSAFGGRVNFANHAPMVADALCALGRDDAVLPWLETYLPHLDPPPPAVAAIDNANASSALGDLARVTDWTESFDREIGENGWRSTIDAWMPRLAPGAYGAFHAFLRTAHAVRPLLGSETPDRCHELAAALGYWAATYGSLGLSTGSSASLTPAIALSEVAQLDAEVRATWLLVTTPMDQLRDFVPFASVVDLIDTSDPDKTISDLTELAARLVVANIDQVGPRGFCHVLTMAAAARLLLPALSPESAEIAVRYTWQFVAACYAALTPVDPTTGVASPPESIDRLVDEALACPDEHGIKVLEACVREHALNPDPVYLVAAQETTRQLRTRGVDLSLDRSR